MKNKIFKAVSVLLTLAIVLSVCVCAVGTVSAATATYYVSAAGSDANVGTSANSAVATVAKAVELANAAYGAGDTVTIRVTGNSVDLGTIPAYAYDLVVEGIDATQTEISSTASKAVIANNENGTTRFRNVQFISTASYASFLMNSSKNVIFESTVKGFTATKYAAFGSYNDGQAAKTVAGQNIEFYNTVGFVFVGNGDSGWQRRTITEDLNITVAGGGSPNFYLNPSSNSSATYQKNLNFNIKNASSVTFTNAGTITVEGAVQIINSTNANITSENTVLAAIDGDKYIITNITGKSDIIEFTEIAGKFKVDTSAADCEIVATDKAGNITKVDDDGYLTLANPGDYELSLHRKPQTVTYYISAETGSQFTGEGTKANPYKFVSNAISKAVEDGYTNKDTVIVKLMGEKTIQWGETITPPAHPFKLIVESDDRNNYSNVNIMHGTYLGGPTEVRYGAYKINDIYSQLRINNYDFTIGEGANFSCLYFTFGDNSTRNTIAGQNVTFKNDISAPNIYLSNILHSDGKTYSGDVNVTVDNPYATPVLRLSGQDGTVYYNANVNLLIKDANTISFGSQNKGKNVCNGAIQLIVNSKTSVDPDGIEYLKTTCNPVGGFFHLINTTEYKDLLTVTTTAGEYEVDTEKYDVTASDGTNQIKAEDGFLTLTAGTYTITATQIKEDTAPVITEKLENEVINVWEQENNELNIDNAQSVATVDFGNKTYGDVKINVLNANKITFTGNPTINGSLHIAVNAATTVAGKAAIEAITAKNGKWYIVNNSGSDITFGDEIGEVFYTTSGKELEAVNGSTTIAPKFQNFLLKEGEYTIRVKAKAANKYNNYIEYRGSDLANTYAKIQNGEKLNVVYFGGSVTNGTGASSENATSWRALTGQWLKNTYSNVEINNINAAIGATGTTFGAYRLDRYVIEEKPDLLFIEFSINDYLDLRHTDSNYRERSAMQLETIIRQVRKELPECDIVVLHTTDQNHITTARMGLLYTEAQAHHDIAAHYNIPTINIGGALANALPEDWKSAWSEYVTDTVHPSDKGYEIYYNIIKEYMSNCLLHTKHTGNITKHAIPEMVSNTLRDGDIQYIDADRELLAKSQELGGTGFDYSVGEIYLKKDFGSIVSTAGNDSIFAMEFTGTELTMAINGSSNLSGFKVKIDNGTYQDVASVNVMPRIIATGLTPGKHTVYIKPVSSASGTVLLRIIGFYTRDESKATVKCAKHSFNTYVDREPAKCGKNATKIATCDNGCGTDNIVEVEGTALQHSFNTYVDKEPAKCGKNATKIATCDNECGTEDIVEVKGTALQHNFITYVDKDSAKCGKNATKIAYCDHGCGTEDIVEVEGTALTHKYTNACDKNCNVCNAARTVPAHKYDNDCDKNCNVCNATRKVPAHKYDNACDKNCNVCNAARTVGAHKYDNACDKNCNVCNAARTVPAHKYSHAADTTCNVCNAKRTVKGIHLIKEGSKQYYYKDGVKQTKVTELVKINGKWLYIQKGVWATNVDTLHKINGKWFLIKDGVWKATTGLVEYKGKTFYVIGGKWQSRTGVYKINGKHLYISGGKWNNKVNNLVKYQGKYFLIKSGKWANTTTTLYKKSGKYFYIKSGKWANTATAIVKYNGKQFFVKNGTAQLKFSGKVKVGGKTYTIKAGKVA